MPRTKPTTTYTPRTQPSTEYSTSRWLSYLVQETFWKLLLESWEGAILLESAINTSYSTPRYWLFVEDMTWANVFDLSWESVQWISGNRTNKIDTFYT